MAKYEEPFKDTQEIFEGVIANADLERYVNIKLLSDNKSKTITKVVKANPLLKFETKNDLYIFVNEQVFEQLEGWQKLIVAEEALAGVYFDAENQKIRFTQSAPENLAVTYNYIGKSTRVEFDLLIELLWYKFQDGEIELDQLKKIFDEMRNFCDNIKYNLIL